MAAYSAIIRGILTALKELIAKIPEPIKIEIIQAVFEITFVIVKTLKESTLIIINLGHKKINEKIKKDDNEVNETRKDILKLLIKERELYKQASDIREKYKHKCNICFYKGQLSMIKIMNERNKENKKFVDDIENESVNQTKTVFKDAKKTIDIIKNTISKGSSIDAALNGIYFDKLNKPDALKDSKESKNKNDENEE